MPHSMLNHPDISSYPHLREELRFPSTKNSCMQHYLQSTDAETSLVFPSNWLSVYLALPPETGNHHTRQQSCNKVKNTSRVCFAYLGGRFRDIPHDLTILPLFQDLGK